LLSSQIKINTKDGLRVGLAMSASLGLEDPDTHTELHVTGMDRK